MRLNLLLATVLLLLAGCQPPGESFPDSLVIQHVTIIDAQQGSLEDQTVVIQDGKILRVTPSSNLKLHADNQIIDGSGKFLIPGLWDAHVHFAFIEELAPSMFDLFLVNGVTSVRDTGGRIEFTKKWKDAALADPLSAPRVKIAGPLIDGMPNVYDGSTPFRPELSQGVDDEAAAIALVNHLDSLGVDLLKAYEMLTPAQFKAITQRARELGLKVTGHVPLSMDVISASNAGLNSMEHLRNLEISIADNAQELWDQRLEMLAAGKDMAGGDLRSSIHKAQRVYAITHRNEARIDTVLSVLAKNQTWQIPTLSINAARSERLFLDESRQQTFKYLPPELEKQWLSGAQTVGNQPVPDSALIFSNWSFEMAKRVQDEGIPVMTGTDCPIFFLMPGYSLHDEFMLLTKAGLSPMEILTAATYNPAKYFDMDDELGLIKEGYWADLVLLDEDPMADIDNTRAIEAVFRQGKHYSRSDLDAILERLDQGL